MTVKELISALSSDMIPQDFEVTCKVEALNPHNNEPQTPPTIRVAYGEISAIGLSHRENTRTKETTQVLSIHVAFDEETLSDSEDFIEYIKEVQSRTTDKTKVEE